MRGLCIDMAGATDDAIKLRQEQIKILDSLRFAERAYEDKKAALLISGSIEGKNAETREANLRMSLVTEQDELDLYTTALKINQLELQNALSRIELAKTELTASTAEFGWLGGPGAFAMALEAESRQQMGESIQHMAEAEPNATPGVFVHVTERPADNDFFKSVEDPR